MAFYRKSNLQEMVPWTIDTSMDGVSVSQSDIDTGSPRTGDMIAINANSPSDRWLVAEQFFKDNYEQVFPENSGIPDNWSPEL